MSLQEESISQIPSNSTNNKSADKDDIAELIKEFELFESKKTSQGSLADPFDESDPQIKRDLVRMILQYLASNGYNTSYIVLQEESGIIQSELNSKLPIKKTVKVNVNNGDWESVERLIKEKVNPNRRNRVLYELYKLIYMELIARGEHQKALHYLFKYLKPLESVSNANGDNEFKELCYLLSLKSIQLSSYFQHWPGIQRSRELFIESLSNEFEEDPILINKPFGEDRLIYLLKQAFVYQKIRCYMKKKRSNQERITLDKSEEAIIQPHIDTLLEDYDLFSLPSHMEYCTPTSASTIKTLHCYGEHCIVASGKQSVVFYNYKKKEEIVSLPTPSTIIWDSVLTCNHSTYITATSEGSLVCYSPLSSIASKPNSSSVSSYSISAHRGDAFTVQAHPFIPKLAISGGSDGVVKVWDLTLQSCLKEYNGHSSSVTACIFNPAGNMVISGGRNCQIQAWDLLHLCQISTNKEVGEVSGLDIDSSGRMVAVANKYNCHHLLDLRTNKLEKAFRGVVNCNSNFLRIHFLGDNYLYSGSDTGCVCIWDIRTQGIVQKLVPPQGSGCILECAYNPGNGCMIGGTEKGSLCFWSY